MASRTHLGNRIAPTRFLVFLGLLIVAAALLVPSFGWRHGAMAAFDVAAAIFLVSLKPLLGESHAENMRAHARRNDANRGLLLVVSAATSLAVLIAVGSELIEKGASEPGAVALVIVTLALAWVFSNTVYALHYAHIFYIQSDADGDGREQDSGGIDFPDTPEPNYRDFVYFSFTLGMTFQTSDVEITRTPVRMVAIFHCLAAFVFNLGVIAFTINVLGGG